MGGIGEVSSGFPIGSEIAVDLGDTDFLSRTNTEPHFPAHTRATHSA